MMHCRLSNRDAYIIIGIDEESEYDVCGVRWIASAAMLV